MSSLLRAKCQIHLIRRNQSLYKLLPRSKIFILKTRYLVAEIFIEKKKPIEIICMQTLYIVIDCEWNFVRRLDNYTGLYSHRYRNDDTITFKKVLLEMTDCFLWMDLYVQSQYKETFCRIREHYSIIRGPVRHQGVPPN